MLLFCEAKAKAASRGREIFLSGKILVTTISVFYFFFQLKYSLTYSHLRGLKQVGFQRSVLEGTFTKSLV